MAQVFRRMGRFRRRELAKRDAEEWKRWAAPVDVLLNAISLAESQLTSWLGKAPDVLVTIHRGFRTTKQTSLEVLEQLRDLVPSDLQRITIELSDQVSPERVRIVLKNDPPVAELMVEGTDSSGVESLRDRLVGILDFGARRPPWFRRRQFLLGAGLLAVALGVSQVLGWLTLSLPNAMPLYLGVGLVGLGLFVLFPDFELLTTGGHSRFRRWRRAFAGGVSFAVALLALYGGWEKYVR